MSRRMLAAIAGASVVAGLLLAAVLAVAIPRTHAAAAPGDPRRPRSAPARPPSEEFRINRVRIRRFGAARIEARTPDPLGGPDWAIRVAEEQMFARGPGGREVSSSGPQRCAQLGRILGGRFGWVDGANVFRPVPVGFEGTPERCAAPRPDLGREPALDVFARVADPAGASPRALQSIAWGLTGTGTRADLRVDGRERALAASPDGAFVVPLAFTPARPDVRLTVRYAHGSPVGVDSSFRGDGERSRADLALMSVRAPRFGYALPMLPLAGVVPTIEYRTPDPAGGPAWGVVAAPAQDGRWCVSGFGRIVGGRVGGLDATLGTLADVGPDPNVGCPPPVAQPTARQPLRVFYGSMTLGAGEAADRSALRTQPGRTFVEGIADPRVRTIAIATPRDVRTIIPSKRAHAFLVIYDGDFPTGRIVLTARLAGGRTVTMPGFNANTP